MTDAARQLPGLLIPEASLHRLADDLAARTAGVFARETIDRYDVVGAADVPVTMGCGDACPVYAGKRYLDWQVRHPAGLPRGEGPRDR